MMLRDEVTVVEGKGGPLKQGQIINPHDYIYSENVPARVDYRDTAGKHDSDLRGSWFQETALLCVVQWQLFREKELSPVVHNIVWRGVPYALDGYPLIRVRGGMEHHLTVKLIRRSDAS